MAHWLYRSGYKKARAIQGGTNRLKKAGGFPFCPVTERMKKAFNKKVTIRYHLR